MMCVSRDDRLVVALYGNGFGGHGGAEDLLRAWDLSERLARSMGLPPTHIDAVFRQKPKGLIDGNGYSLRRYRRRFEGEVRAGNVKTLGLDRMAHRGGFAMLDWEFASLLGEDPFASGAFIVGVQLCRIGGLRRGRVREIVDGVIDGATQCMKVLYGFAVVMPRAFMPMGYASGVASTELPDGFKYDVTAWVQSSGKRCGQTLRNVFGYNVLSAAHLQIPVGTQRLDQWIGLEPSRGRVEPKADELYVWTLEQYPGEMSFFRWDGPTVTRTRRALALHGVFPWQKLLTAWEASDV